MKFRYVGEVIIIVHCGSSTFQKYNPYFELYVTGNSCAMASQVLFGKFRYVAAKFKRTGIDLVSPSDIVMLPLARKPDLEV